MKTSYLKRHISQTILHKKREARKLPQLVSLTDILYLEQVAH